jgi:hypothetical protein
MERRPESTACRTRRKATHDSEDHSWARYGAGRSGMAPRGRLHRSQRPYRPERSGDCEFLQPRETEADGGRGTKTLRVFALARAVCRDVAMRAQDELVGATGPTLARRLADAKTIAAVERLARADSRLTRRSGDFDSDPWALNTPGGVVDLRTGAIRQPHPQELGARNKDPRANRFGSRLSTAHVAGFAGWCRRT